jgi:hypothetical protein
VSHLSAHYLDKPPFGAKIPRIASEGVSGSHDGVAALGRMSQSGVKSLGKFRSVEIQVSEDASQKSRNNQ